MKQEDKELLLKDLCARLPYGVFCDMGLDYPLPLQRLFVDRLDGILLDFYEDGDDYQVYLDEVKPYLFPLSSMTEEQCYKLSSIRSGFQDCWKYVKTPIPLSICNFEQIDWFHKNHIDYRGLIEKGLALDATDKNIY